MSDRAVMPLSDYVSACDNIREKTQITEMIKSGELSEKIEEVYEAGKKAEHDNFWDVYQHNGNRTNYPNTYGAFSGYSFSFDNFYPKYDIRPKGNATMLFYAWTGNILPNVIGSLKQRLEECGVVLDTSEATSLGQIFSYTHFTELPIISFVSVTSSGTNNNAIRSAFSQNPHLETIEKIIVTENTHYETWFNNDTNLKNVTFEGVIGQNGLDFSPCTKFSAESCHSTFTHLKDFRQPTIISTNVTSILTPTVIGKGTLRAGQQYTWRYYISLYPGWMVDDPTQNPIYDPKKELSPEETLITSTAQEIIINGNTYIGFKAECRDFPADVDGGHFVYVYQDGENIVVYPVISGMDSADTIELTLMVATETRTITMPKAVKDNGNATPEDIAEATDRGWTIAWAE